MVASLTPHRWTLDEFLGAWEAGVITERVELLDGEIWDVSMGPWHGDTTIRVARALPNDTFRITAMSLPSGDSLPGPDCCVLRPNAQPVEKLSRRIGRWAARDVLLVVEVSDETVQYDLGRKAEMYAAAGYAHYWTVTEVGVYVHGRPTAHGPRLRRPPTGRGRRARGSSVLPPGQPRCRTPHRRVNDFNPQAG